MSGEGRQDGSHTQRPFLIENLLLQLFVPFHKALWKRATPTIQITHPEPVEVGRAAEECFQVLVRQAKLMVNPAPDGVLSRDGEGHIDAAYGGEDYTAFSIVRKKDGKYYVFGKLWRKHIDDCLDEIQSFRQEFNAGKIFCEDNGDKGYLAKELRRRGERAVLYHENMNKFLKITSYLKAEWNNVIFVAGTDKEFINQICDYNENAEHDDAPDSVASQIRRLWNRKDTVSTYQSILR